jgi:O-antigen ligase
MQRFGTEWLAWTVRHQGALCVLLALTVASSLWSLVPATTLQKSVSLLGTTLLGLYIGCACRPPAVLRVLYWAFLLLIVSSLVVAWLAGPSIAPGVQRWGWSGIMDYKNSFGAAAAFATVFFLVVTLTRRVHPIWGATLSILSLFALVQANSITSWIALAVSIGALAYVGVGSTARRPTPAVMQRMTLGLVLGVFVFPLLVTPLATAVGTDGALNNRTRMWAAALTIVRERPATGYGYEAVWGRGDATLLPHISTTAEPWALNAHNSILDVATGLGIPGAIVACIYLFGALSGAGRLVVREPSALFCFAFVFLVGMTVMSVTEAHLLRIHSMFWILLVALTVTIERVAGGALLQGTAE